MGEGPSRTNLTRREMLGTVGKAAVASAVVPPFVFQLDGSALLGGADPLAAVAGPDRVVVQPGKTFLNAWAGYGVPPWQRRRRFRGEPEAPEPSGPEPKVAWSKKSGPGQVVFEDPEALVTSATFSAPGAYELEMVADNGESKAASTFTVTVEDGPPPDHLMPIETGFYRLDDPFWGRQVKALMVNWIPHCIEMINRNDLELGPGGIDNFVEAGKALRGEPHGPHKGYVFSNAWVHETVESMSLALMIDPMGDPEVQAAHRQMRDTLEAWIPIILAAQEPDGYLHTSWTCRDAADGEAGPAGRRWVGRWNPENRGNHEGYVAGYFIESAINHHMMTEGKDARLYDAARKLADLWYDHIGPPPKQEWFDGHQEMEQALVRFGHYVNDVEGNRDGDRYIALAKFLLDCRGGGSQYDQSHLPVVQQYEAVGHAVRAVYTYSGMADIAMETRDVDYQSAVRSLWDSVVNRKYYLTGGVGSGETSEGFGPDYSLRNNSYCETCSSCGEIFFQSKMNRMYKDAKYADLYEETLYNALLGSTDLEAEHYYYDNPLDTNIPRYAWHTCPCCVGNFPRTVFMLPTWMYAKGSDGLYVNLFVGSTVTVPDVAGTDVEIVQKTGYPWAGDVALTVNPKQSRRFAIRVRVPNRSVSTLYRTTPEVNGVRALRVNGETVQPKIERGYAVLERTWKAGDRIELDLPLEVQRVHADERIAANEGRVALKYGPLVYNIEIEDNGGIAKKLPASSQLTTTWRDDFLDGVKVIEGRFSDGSRMTAVPNFARANRLAGTDAPRRPERPADGGRPQPFAATSIVWIEEA